MQQWGNHDSLLVMHVIENHSIEKQWEKKWRKRNLKWYKKLSRADVCVPFWNTEWNDGTHFHFIHKKCDMKIVMPHQWKNVNQCTKWRENTILDIHTWCDAIVLHFPFFSHLFCSLFAWLFQLWICRKMNTFAAASIEIIVVSVMSFELQIHRQRK